MTPPLTVPAEPTERNRKMEKEYLLQVLVEFFRDEFSADAAGVGDWLVRSGADVDEFIGSLNALFPKASS